MASVIAQANAKANLQSMTLEDLLKDYPPQRNILKQPCRERDRAIKKLALPSQIVCGCPHCIRPEDEDEDGADNREDADDADDGDDEDG